MSVISISDLNYAYKKNDLILKGLNMTVPNGSIYGFLGANGAGKSTTIRNVLGLLKPQSGSITLFEKELLYNKKEVFQNIGSLIESPSLYGHLNGPDHLKIACQYLNVSTKNNDALLDKVGLLQHRKKSVKKYSTGMKQRLGLAMALVHNPALIILDEPTNGLDPTGIREIRELLIQLQEDGKTIMLSSHLLSEIEKVATHVGILKEGKMLFEGTLLELDQLKSAKSIVEITTNDIEKTKVVLSSYTIIETSNNTLKLDLPNRDELPILIKKMVANDIDIYGVHIVKSDLENMFISMTDKNANN